MSDSLSHRERVTYRWIDLTPAQVSALAVRLPSRLETRVKEDGCHCVAWVVLDAPEVCTAVREAVEAQDFEVPRGLYVSLRSEEWTDVVVIEGYVSEMYRAVGGDIDFSFTTVGYPSPPGPAVWKPEGVNYSYRMHSLSRDVMQRLASAISNQGAPIEVGASGHLVLPLPTPEVAEVVLRALHVLGIEGEPGLLDVELVTERDSDGVHLAEFVRHFLLSVGGLLEFSFTMLPDS